MNIHCFARIRRACLLINYVVWEARAEGLGLSEWLDSYPEVAEEVSNLLEASGYKWKGWGYVNEATQSYILWEEYPEECDLTDLT